MQFLIELPNKSTGSVYKIFVSADEAKRIETDENFRNFKLQEAMEAAEMEDTYSDVEWLHLPTNEKNRPGCSFDPVVNNLEIINENDKENTPIENSQCQEDSGFRWPHQAILLLLEQYRQKEDVLVKGKVSHKKFWADVACKMQEHGHQLSGPQCQSKFSGMKKTYKSIKDHNQKSGNSTRTWPYLTTMDDLMGEKPFMPPLSTYSTARRTRTYSESSVGSDSGKRCRTHSESSVRSDSGMSTCTTTTIAKKPRRDAVLDGILQRINETYDERVRANKKKEQQKDRMIDLFEQFLNKTNP